MTRRILLNIGLAMLSCIVASYSIFIISYGDMESLKCLICIMTSILFVFIHKLAVSRLLKGILYSLTAVCLYKLYEWTFASYGIYEIVGILFILIVHAIPNTLFVLMLHRFKICTDCFCNYRNFVFESYCYGTLYYGLIALNKNIVKYECLNFFEVILIAYVILLTYFLMRYALNDEP